MSETLVPVEIIDKLRFVVALLDGAGVDDGTYQAGLEAVTEAHERMVAVIEGLHEAMEALQEERDGAVRSLTELEEALDNWDGTDNGRVVDLVGEVKETLWEEVRSDFADEIEEWLQEDALEYAFTCQDENLREALANLAGRKMWDSAVSGLADTLTAGWNTDLEEDQIAVLEAIIQRARGQ